MSKPRGRPTKFNDEIAEKICQLVRVGNYVETAAASAGINKDTLYHWLRQNRNFSDAVQKACADSEALDVARIAQATSEHWQAAAWRLERKNPRKWGARVQISVQQELESILDKIEARLDPATYHEVLAAIASDAGSPALGPSQGERDGGAPAVAPVDPEDDAEVRGADAPEPTDGEA